MDGVATGCFDFLNTFFFCLGSGWIFFSYHHLKTIASELFKINVG